MTAIEIAPEILTENLPHVPLEITSRFFNNKKNLAVSSGIKYRFLYGFYQWFHQKILQIAGEILTDISLGIPYLHVFF